MFKRIAIGLIVFAIVVGTLYSENVVQAFDTVFSVGVDGDVVRSRGRWRTGRNGVTRFRARGRVARDGSCDGGRDFGSCNQGRDYGSCNQGNDYGSCNQGNDYGSCDQDNSSYILRW